MATASHPQAAPATSARGSGALKRFGPATATVVGVAVLMRLVYAPWYLNYDARYALVWARDLFDGHTPDFETPFAPTPHPLSNAWSALALPFGQDGDRLMVWLVLLAFGILVWLVYRLGAELFSRPVGIVAAVVVLTRPALVRDVLLTYQDVPFAALVVGAVLVEARKPRRGTATLVLLALAGMLRPEAWVLAGLYWLYVARERGWGDRARLAAIAASGPALWALMDLLVTGDPLHSLHGTSALAETADRRRHLHQVPYWTAQYFGYVLREPLLVGIPLGLAFAWRRRLGGARLPLAVAAALVAVFAIGPIFGLPLISRYIRTPAILLILFYGLAVCGWMLIRTPGRERRAWQVVAAVAVLASVVYLPWHWDMLRSFEGRIDRHGTLYAGLRELGRDDTVRAALRRCGPIAAADHRPIPYLRWWLDSPPGSVVTVEGGAARADQLLLVPKPIERVRNFYRENFPADVRAPSDWRVLRETRAWRLLAAPGCVTRLRA
jgi:hypothetical protein